jgi:hypothetical protein
MTSPTVQSAVAREGPCERIPQYNLPQRSHLLLDFQHGARSIINSGELIFRSFRYLAL